MMQTNIKGERSIAQVLKEERLANELTLQEVADAIGCSPSYLHRLENSSRKNPSMNMVQKLAEFYQMEIDQLLNGDSGSEANRNSDEALKAILQTELNIGLKEVKKGLDYMDTDLERSKQALIDAQKSLLYLLSLL